MPSGGAAVEVSDLVVRYGSTTAVDGVSFTAAPGEVLAVLGPNGAGKTTTIEALEGYRPPTSGTVRVLGLDPRRDARALASRIGVMLQRDGVYLTMGPADVLRLFAAYYGDRARPAAEVLTLLGLDRVARTPWRRLSGGEQQRLKLAMAIIGRPEVAFLDEPTAAVDADARRIVRRIIDELRGEGCCVLVSTHELDEAERMADRVVILDHGRVVADGTPASLRDQRVGGAVAVLRFSTSATIDTGSLSVHLGAAVTGSGPGQYVAELEPTPAAVASLTAWLADHGVELGDLRAGRASLEDVFLALTAPGGEPPPTNRARTRRRS
jgi:ABC-2 type transport system ATP-binding protein